MCVKEKPTFKSRNAIEHTISDHVTLGNTTNSHQAAKPSGLGYKQPQIIP